MLNVFVQILEQKHWTGCSVAAARPTEPALLSFAFLGPQGQKNVTDDGILSSKSYISLPGHLTDLHQICMLDITMLFMSIFFLNYFIK